MRVTHLLLLKMSVRQDRSLRSVKLQIEMLFLLRLVSALASKTSPRPSKKARLSLSTWLSRVTFLVLLKHLKMHFSRLKLMIQFSYVSSTVVLVLLLRAMLTWQQLTTQSLSDSTSSQITRPRNELTAKVLTFVSTQLSMQHLMTLRNHSRECSSQNTKKPLLVQPRFARSSSLQRLAQSQVLSFAQVQLRETALLVSLVMARCLLRT